MSAKAKIGETWKSAIAPYVKVSGVWKVAESAWVKVSGQWKSWFLQGGLLDSVFAQNISSYYYFNFPEYRTIAVQSTGKIVVGGSFVISTPSYNAHIARFNSDGTLDQTFTSGNMSVPIQTIHVLPDDSLLIGRNSSVGLILFKSSSNNNVDTSFRANLGSGFSGSSSFTGTASAIFSIKTTATNSLLIGGSFTGLNGSSAGHFVQLNSNGTLDTTFQSAVGTAANNYVKTIAVQSDGKILLGGNFTSFNQTSAGRLARLNSDGTLDSAFMANIGSGFNVAVESVVVQPDNKILVSGGWTTFNGISRPRILRLNSDGTIDPTFTAGGSWATPPRIILLENGSVLVYGQKNSGTSLSAGIHRLNSSGGLDSAFLQNAGTGIGWSGTPVVYDAISQTDGKILLAGRITSFNEVPSTHMVRIGGEIAY